MDKLNYKTLNFNLGRDCLRYIIKTFDIREMKVPYYLCDVVRHTLFEEGCKPVFYHIDDNFLPVGNFSQDDFILYPNYFGICGENVKNLVNIYPNIITDNAHAYYDKPSGFACFNAGHKFGKEKSTLWIKGKSSEQNNTEPDFSYKNSFIELHKKYGAENLLKIDIENIKVPFVYPLLVKTIDEADKIAESIKKEGKTIYRYWSPLPKSFSEYKFYSRLVPIPLN